MNRENLKSLLELRGLGDVSDAILSVTRKCVRLVAAEDQRVKISLGTSKVGGNADLPENIAWPNRDGRSLMFLAQIALADIPPVDEPIGLPSSGLLSFFYDATEQQAWGFDPADADSAAVIYTPPSIRLVRRDEPDDISEEGFGEYRLMPIEYCSLPSWGRPETESLNLNERQLEAYLDVLSELSPEYPATCHQLLGWPHEIQGPMELECQLVTNGLYCGNESGYRDPRAMQLSREAYDWCLLMQLGSDDRAGMMWGDAGCLYYWIRKQDLSRRSFDATWIILQCY